MVYQNKPTIKNFIALNANTIDSSKLGCLKGKLLTLFLEEGWLLQFNAILIYAICAVKYARKKYWTITRSDQDIQ